MLRGCEAWVNVTWHTISVFARDLFLIADLYDRSTFIWIWPCICSSSLPLQITSGMVANLGAGLCRVIIWQRRSPGGYLLLIRIWKHLTCKDDETLCWQVSSEQTGVKQSLSLPAFFSFFLEGFTEDIYFFKPSSFYCFPQNSLTARVFPRCLFIASVSVTGKTQLAGLGGDSWSWHHPLGKSASCWHGEEGETLPCRRDESACKIKRIRAKVEHLTCFSLPEEIMSQNSRCRLGLEFLNCPPTPPFFLKTPLYSFSSGT